MYSSGTTINVDVFRIVDGDPVDAKNRTHATTAIVTVRVAAAGVNLNKSTSTLLIGTTEAPMIPQPVNTIYCLTRQFTGFLQEKEWIE